MTSPHFQQTPADQAAMRWARVSEIVADALVVEGLSARDAFVTEACAGDVALETELRSLLVADGATELLPEDAFAVAASGFVTAPEAERPDRSGEPVTTASDLYALGVILDRLLTGASPYRAAPTAPLDLAREICEGEPTRPSRVGLDRTATGPRAGAAAAGPLMDARVFLSGTFSYD